MTTTATVPSTAPRPAPDGSAARLVLDRARALAPEVRAAAEEGERLRRLPDALVDRMRRAELFAMLLPVEYGGLGLDLPDALPVIEVVSAADGAAGWCLLKGAATNQMAAYLDPGAAREIWSDPGVVTGGSFNPRGRAVPVPGGYRLTGRWDWGTGSAHAAWLMVGAMVATDGDGPPAPRTFFVPRRDVEIIDTWRTAGMRGTGSNDIAVDDVLVPEAFTFDGMTAAARVPGANQAVPYAQQAAAPHGALAIGIARGALADFAALATAKVPLMGRSRLADDEVVQHRFARAAATTDAAASHLRTCVASVWEAAAGGAPAPAAAGALGLAAVHATTAALEAVDTVHQLAGGTAVHTSSPLQRAFRDLHVAASHFLVAPARYTAAGRALLSAPAPAGPA